MFQRCWNNKRYIYYTSSDRAIQMQNDAYIFFADYIKALDTVWHRYVRIIKNFYWAQTAEM